MRRARPIGILLLFIFCWAAGSSLYAQGTVTAERFPTAVADGGGTGTTGYPYAVFVRIQGSTPNAQVFLKVFNVGNNEYMWSATNVWSNGTAFSSSNQPAPTLDGSGNWAGWIHAKHNTTVGATVAVRFRISGTDKNITSSSRTLNILAMSPAGTGGWIVRSSSPAVNKAIAAYTGANLVGSYRTEENNITEGYSYGAGGFKIAVPAGVVDSLVTYNDDGSRDQLFVGPWVVTAGQETDASASAGQVGHGSASLSPGMISGGTTQQITLSLRGESPYTLTNARVAFPADWSWSGLPGDVTLIGEGSPSASVAGDTIVVDGMSLVGGDSIQVMVNNVMPPDTTARFSFHVSTGTHPDSVYALSTQPGLLVYGTPQPISSVKVNDANGVPLLLHQLVTIRGIVTAGNEFGGGPTFIQDNSGGMAIYGPTLSRSVRIGDEILVTGTMDPFNGLAEIVNPILHGILSTGNSVDPLVVTVGQIAHDGVGGVENYEGLLVRLNDVTTSAAGTWGSATNYFLFGGADTTQVRIDDSTTIVGKPVPSGAFDLVGVVGQFVRTSPYIGGYQVQPRFTADVFSAGPVISTFPSLTDIQPNSLTVVWETLHPGTTRLYYGKTSSLELGVAGDDQLDTAHTVQLTSLEPATVYYIRAFSVAASETSFASPLIACTASPLTTTGVINVYFNKSVDHSLAQPTPALGNQDLTSRVITRINNARRSIDVALYSLSSTPGDAIANALISALVRGVKVRVICEYDNKDSDPFSRLRGSGVPMIDDRFDPINVGVGLMHNKFFVFDGRGGAPESVWVWTGSWNPTLGGTMEDYQNSIEIQDAAFARAYTLEFEEMWGSTTETANASVSRFGARKTDNTPHQFVIGGRTVEAYFSPSDRTTSRIIAAVNAAERSVAVGTMTLTRSDIATALVARKNGGKKVRVLLDNNVDTGTQFFYLQSQGMDVHLKTGGGIFHHKYMLVDGDYPPGNPLALTGSHNWSNSAENSHNENTIIIHDADIANQYLQEFAARYYQFGGTDTISTDVGMTNGDAAAEFALEQNYPNPFNPTTTIEYDIGGVVASTNVRLAVYDLLGREVAVLVNERKAPGRYQVRFDASRLSSGVYFYRFQSGDFVRTRKMLVLK